MLTDPILLLDTNRGSHLSTLPEALACLCDASLIGFDGLAAHQRHAWYLFLCQSVALALMRSGELDAVEDDTAWVILPTPRDGADGSRTSRGVAPTRRGRWWPMI